MSKYLSALKCPGWQVSYPRSDARISIYPPKAASRSLGAFHNPAAVLTRSRVTRFKDRGTVATRCKEPAITR